MRRWRNWLNKLLLAIYIMQLLIPLVPDKSFAAEENTKRLYINFETQDVSESPLTSYFSSRDSISFQKNIGDYIDGNVTKVQFYLNGNSSSSATVDGVTLKVNVSLNENEATPVYGKSDTNPGHHIYRLPTGKGWENNAITTPQPMQFTADSSTLDGSGVSQYPGLIPSKGNYRGSTSQVDYSPDLRYTYTLDPSKDKKPNYYYEGAGVTASYEAGSPEDYYTKDQLTNPDQGDIVSLSDIVKSSIEIYNASPSDNFPDAVPFFWGKGNKDGTGLVKVRRLFLDRKTIYDDNGNKQDLGPMSRGDDYDPVKDPQGLPHGEDRNYYMTINTYWKGITYAYNGYVDITTTPPVTPDIVPLDIKPDKACFKTGESVSFMYSWNNIGVSTSSTYKVSLKIDGVEVDSETVPGHNKGVPLGKPFSYTFTSSVEKQFTIVVNSDGGVNEGANTSNNVLTKSFAPQSSCDGGGEPPDPEPGTMTGRIWPDKELINWKDNNLVWFEVEEKGCTLKKYKFEFKGNGGVWNMPPVQVGWYDSNGETKKAMPFNYDTVTRMYPGNIQDGQVQVRVTVLDSCGSESIIGPGTFTIGPPPPDTPPELRIAFIDPADGSETGQVILGDRVDLKVTRLFDADGDPLTLQWLFTDSEATDWIRGLPAKHGWTTPYNKMSYTGMTADTVGLQLVCATASDGVKTTKSCTNLNVIPPNPVPKINGPQVIKVNRPVNPPWDSSQSYSPVKGRTIDHNRDEWTNALPKYTTAGEYTISLHVFDNTGLKSLSPDTWNLMVIPDQPPVIDFLYSDTISRVAPSYFKNNSRSPDGDTIVKYETWYGYDANNNGSCNPYENLISTNNNNFPFHPSKVGKYCFRLYAEEDYGLSNWKDYTVEVTNDNPEVTFMVSGQTNEPVPVTTVPLPTSSLLGNSWVNTSLDKSTFPKTLWSLTPDGTLTTNTRDMKTPIGVRKFDEISDNDNYGLIEGDPNLTFPHDATSLTEIGSLGSVTFSGNPKNYITESTPQYYLGDNMFIQYVSYPYASLQIPYFYLVGTNLPAPIKLMEGNYSENGNIYVREDIDEVILLMYYESWNNTIEYTYQRHKLSALKAGNIVPASTIHERKVYQNSEQPEVKITFSDGKDRQYMDGFIKTPVDYKRIDLVNRKIESFSFDNLITPYKVENYTHINALPAREWKSGVYTFNFPYLRGFVTPGGKVINSHYGGFIWYDTIEQTLNFRDMSYYGGPGGAAYPSGVSPNDDYIAYSIGSYSGSRGYVVNLRTGDVHANGCGEEGGYWDYDQLDDDGNPTWVSGNWVCRWYPEIPSDQQDVLNYKKNNQYGFARDPIDGYTVINKYYQNENWLADSRTGQLLWNIGGTCGKTPRVYAAGLMVMCGKVYSFPHSESHPASSKEFFTFGQLVNPSLQPLVNGTLKWSMRINNLKYDYVPAGMSFRIQDNQNMYRVESMKDRLRLIKIVNGEKTLLAESLRYLPNGAWAAYSVKLTGNEIKVYQNGTPLFTVYDNTFATGTYGPYSVHETTEFKEMAVVLTSPQLVTKTYGAAVVDTTVNYETTYEDPENDPRFDNGTQWRYTHVDPFMFLDVGDGKSGYSSKNGALVTTPIMSFDKVGKYNVEYRAPDDPHPDHRLSNGDPSFQGYSKYSNWYLQPLIVHRAPIVYFTVTPTASNTIQWTDSSYDPDHCYNAGSCQSGYESDRGIKFEKYYYITPSGYTVSGKLVHPAESGTYTVAKAVGDEYYAWSDWLERSVTVNCNPCVANTPPTVFLTFPNGGYGNPSPVSLRPTISWNQGDIDPGTIFTVFDIEIKDIYGNCYECVYNRSMNTTNTSWAWTMDTQLQMGGQYQVRIRVSDGEAFSDWSNIGWMITNRPPLTYMSFPFGTQADPTYITTTRPQFQWTQTDPDPGTTFTYFQLQVANAANGVILDTGNVWQGTTSTTGSYTPGVDMPTNEPLRVRVQVTDGFAWSGFSPDAWMIINRPPMVTLTYPDGTQSAPNIVESNTPTVTWNQMDLDSGASFSYFEVQVLNEAGTVIVDSGRVWQGTNATSGSWTVNTPLPEGQKLQVRVNVWDQFDSSSGWSNTGWLYINRPPSGNITFSTPIYENDTPSFTVSAIDPDGDALSIKVESSFNGAPFSVIQQWSNVPSGQDKIFTYGPLPKGNYTLRLTLDDGHGGTYEQTYSFIVLPLTITGWVTHTPEWESYRQTWNAKHPTDQRAVSDFWAGEVFVLSAAVTDTGTSSTKPISVTSRLLTTSENVTLSSSNLINYSGELLNTNHDRILSDGNHTFRFTVTWSNGLVQTYDVAITIKDVIWDVIVNQIRH